MKKQVYIVTGATGHLGSHVVRELLLRGCRVRALVLPNEKCPEFIDVNRYLLTEYTGNVCNLASLTPIFNGDKSEELIVIHCAGIVSITKREDRRVFDVNVGGTKNIIAACKEYSAKRLVYISSVHAIPPLPHGQVMKEVESFSPDRVPGYYDKTKAIATQLVLDAVKNGQDAIVLHPSGIIGPHGLPTGNMTRLIRLYLLGRLHTAVHGGFDFVDVRDVAAGVVSSVRKGISGECYVLSNRFVKLKEMFAILSQTGTKSRIRLYLPLWIVKVIAPAAELYCRLTRKAPLFTRYSLDTLSENGMYSHEKASRELNYVTRTLRETLSDTAAWVLARQHGTL